MTVKISKKYFSIVFLLLTLLGSMHHHDDFTTHSDCQICILQSNLSGGDTPEVVAYLPTIETVSESITHVVTRYHSTKPHLPFDSRAPPIISS